MQVCIAVKGEKYVYFGLNGLRSIFTMDFLPVYKKEDIKPGAKADILQIKHSNNQSRIEVVRYRQLLGKKSAK